MLRRSSHRIYAHGALRTRRVRKSGKALLHPTTLAVRTDLDGTVIRNGLRRLTGVARRKHVHDGAAPGFVRWSARANTLWSVLFFGLRSPGVALVEMLVLWETQR
jgi:hypothetical protein